MKLDATDVRYISAEEFRVLTAVEMGSKNHEVVPTPLISQISGLRGGGVNKLLGELARRNLVAKVQNVTYDGYRLTYGGYDYLALRALSKRDSVFSVGNQIGVGKESDIYIVADAEGNEMVMKMHRLGRTSFRSIKSKRDYLGKRKSASWMYMSRLSAQREWAFMKVLHEHGFPIPKPIDQARHIVVMEFIDAYPLRQIAEVPQPGKLYSSLMDLIVRFAQAGLIHGDFNEFNILIHRKTGEPIVIDFPQMVSTSHANAEEYFNRDVECIRTFFKRRFDYESKLYPRFSSTLQETEGETGEGFRLDVVVAASGFKKKDQDALEQYMSVVRQHTEASTESQALGARSQEEHSDSTEEEIVEEGEDEEDVVADAEETNDTGATTTDDTESQDASRDPRDRSLAPSPSSSLADELANRMANIDLSPPRVAPELDDEDDAEDPDKTVSQIDPPLAEDSEARSSEGDADADGEGEEDRETEAPAKSGEPAVDSKAILRQLVASQVQRQQKKQKVKYHSKKGGPGRKIGSKAKQDSRVKASDADFW